MNSFLRAICSFFAFAKKLDKAQKVNNDGTALCGFASYRFLKEMVSYIELPFGEWGQNYGDFILDARG